MYWSPKTRHRPSAGSMGGCRLVNSCGRPGIRTADADWSPAPANELRSSSIRATRSGVKSFQKEGGLGNVEASECASCSAMVNSHKRERVVEPVGGASDCRFLLGMCRVLATELRGCRIPSGVTKLSGDRKCFYCARSIPQVNVYLLRMDVLRRYLHSYREPHQNKTPSYYVIRSPLQQDKTTTRDLLESSALSSTRGVTQMLGMGRSSYKRDD